MKYLCSLSFFLFISIFLLGSALEAKAYVGNCSGESTTKDACQFRIHSDSAAPSPGISAGIRLDAGTRRVFFYNYPSSLPPVFISNLGSTDIFVPQNTEHEFASFFQAATNGTIPSILFNYALPPTDYVAVPPNTLAGCLRVAFLPQGQSVNVPPVSSSEDPYIFQGYTLLPSNLVSNPAGLTISASPAQPFAGQRIDCSLDNEGLHPCAYPVYSDSQSILFRAQGYAPNYSWNTSSPEVTHNLTRSLDGITTIVSDCSQTMAPRISGLCGPSNGTVLASAPTGNLCSRGDATSVSALTTSFGLKWVWNCLDVQGTSGGIENNPLSGTGVSCSACQDVAKQVVSACSVTCGGGTQTVSTYDGCGNLQTQTTQPCNTDVCCTPHASQNLIGSCSTSCGGGTQTMQWYNSCGQAEDSYQVSCNTQACCTSHAWNNAVGTCSAPCGGGTQAMQWYNSCGQPEEIFNQGCNTQACCTSHAWNIPLSGCSVSCGDGTQTMQWYNSCSQPEDVFNQPCNTGVCCVSHAKNSAISACSASCGGGTQTVQWYNSCGQAEDTFQQSCNTQTCCSVDDAVAFDAFAIYYCARVDCRTVTGAWSVMELQVEAALSAGDVCTASLVRKNQNDGVTWFNAAAQQYYWATGGFY